MHVSILAEGNFGLNWPRWKRLVDEIEKMGFAGLYCADHFITPGPPADSLDLMVALSYLADHSQRLHFGSLVAPLSFRDPILLARQAMALNELSDGRMILGVGAGWWEPEHTMFGYDLGSVSHRLDRLEEGLEVITRLIRNDEPVTFEGRFYQLQEAYLRPQRATPLLVGGNGPKRTLPLVARYADIWNCEVVSPELFRERSALLDDLLRSEGRHPDAVRRTVMTSVLCWHDQEDLERQADLLREFAFFADKSTEELKDFFVEAFAAMLGTPDEVIKQMDAYANAGADEMILMWFSPDDIDGLATIAERVLPHFTS
jgi:alkanesulfonate monooxygenase SsuD/methylene tetrahydromethanopterin reductase-like flavin-dependent oxidoreductase (luciferase family)